MAKEVVFSPLSKIDNVIEAPKKIDVPQYADSGVDYTGFSKKLYAENTYRLNKQDEYDFTAFYTAVGGETTISGNRENKDIKDFYVKKIILSGGKAGLVAQGDTITISDGNTIRFRIYEPTGSQWTLQFDFLVPLKFSKGNSMRTTFSAARVAGDITGVNYIGWEED